MKVGNQLRNVTTMDELKKAIKNIIIRKCQIVYGGNTYTLESDGKGKVVVERVQSTSVQVNNEIAGAVHHLKCARIRYYVIYVHAAYDA